MPTAPRGRVHAPAVQQLVRDEHAHHLRHPLATTKGCAPEIGTSWDTAPVVGSAAAPTAVQCRLFDGKPGERITSEIRTTSYGQSVAWITDETGARICPYLNGDGSKGCVLPGDGPYRVLSQVTDTEHGFPAEYTLAVRRTSDPAGCAHPAERV